jgi:feruloyl esterase
MQHCILGPGNWLIGQGAGVGELSNAVNDTSHNVLLALVDWVENGVAPDTIIGISLNGTARTHCRYPFYESRWNGTDWICQPSI